MPRIWHLIPIAVLLSLTWIPTASGQAGRGRQRARPDTLAVQADSLLDGRIQALERRLQELEDHLNRQQQQARLQSLRQRAQQRAQEARRGGPADTRTVRFTSQQRQLNALNPELSLSGDFMGFIRSPETSRFNDGREMTPAFAAGNRFWLREAEINIVAPLDPYTRGKFFFSLPSHEGISIEEAYMSWINLPTDLNLKIGYYRNEFGQLNRWHDHGLPQVDRPHVLQTFLGGETGLAGLGISANWVIPTLLSDVQELTVEFITGGDGISFSDDLKRGRVALGRLLNYWDITSNAYLELGLSGAYGNNDEFRLYETKLGGLDLSYKWVPAGRGRYRSFELRSEVIASWRDTPTGEVQSWGTYASIRNRFGARLLGSLRLDYTQLPADNGQNLQAIAATIEYWQSEFVFFRIQIDRIERTFADSENRLIFQTVWSMGPHKHEAY